jgi:integrase
VLRRLRHGATLKRAAGAWQLDLTERRGQHKTAKFYGPSVTTINDLVGHWLSKYIELITLDRMGDGEVYYLFPVGNDFSRCVASSQWTAMVKATFKRWAGIEVPPKMLRASFISWLKGRTDAPEVLKAAAVAQRHLEETQGSSRYDVEVRPPPLRPPSIPGPDRR